MKTQKTILIRDQVLVIQKLQMQQDPEPEKIAEAVSTLLILESMPEIPFCEPLMNTERENWLANLKEGDKIKTFEENGAYQVIGEITKTTNTSVWSDSFSGSIRKKFGAIRMGDRLLWIEPAD
jgi:hypothetical protein